MPEHRTNEMQSTGYGTPTSRVSYEVFHENFDVRLAETAEDVERCQRLRYQVYCVERHWCEEIHAESEREFDRFDDRSAHAMLFNRPTGQLIGTVRLVLPNEGEERPDLPVEEVAGWPLPFAEDLPAPEKVGEISRFAVAKHFLLQAIRNDTGEDAKDPSEVIWEGEERSVPRISIGLMRGIHLMARKHGITYLVAILEPALVKLFERIDVRFAACGKPRFYHGVRQPCYVRMEDLARGMKDRRPDLYRIVFEDPAPESSSMPGGAEKIGY